MTMSREDKLQRITSVLDNIGRRLDRAERADAQARADADEAEKVRRRKAEREQLATTQLECAEYQARVDSILAPYSVRAPTAVAGETSEMYCRRLLDIARARLPATHELYRLNLASVPRDAFRVFSDSILEAVEASAFDPGSVPHGALVERIADDVYSGKKVKMFVGDTSFVADPVYGGRPGRKVLRLVNHATGQVLVGPPQSKLN
jgi:hypothetical protein